MEQKHAEQSWIVPQLTLDVAYWWWTITTSLIAAVAAASRRRHRHSLLPLRSSNGWSRGRAVEGTSSILHSSCSMHYQSRSYHYFCSVLYATRAPAPSAASCSSVTSLRLSTTDCCLPVCRLHLHRQAFLFYRFRIFMSSYYFQALSGQPHFGQFMSSY